jgi:MFS family permease
MWQVLIGRAISGSGGSGMGAIGLVIMTGWLLLSEYRLEWTYSFQDIVPLREIGTWHSYLNTIHTTGRLLGGPVGGWLADEIGWRW